MEIKFLEDELWYPATSEYGKDMPYDSMLYMQVKLCNNPTSNQMSTFLLSNKGRVLFNYEGFIADFCYGLIKIDRDIYYVETFCKDNTYKEIFIKDNTKRAVDETSRFPIEKRGNLKTAFRYISEKIFKKTKGYITNKFLKLPIYNTWMYMPFEINQDIVMEYCNTVLAEGLPVGIIIIDDKWNKEYGDWIFDKHKFPNPKHMINELHKKGFLVMLWICPYVDFNSESYTYCKNSGYLLNKGEEVYRLEWWNGKSACFDLRKPKVIAYIKRILEDLQNLGVDGFKFDGGDSRFYLDEHEPDLQSYNWAKLAGEYRLNEIRVDFNTFSLPIFERLSDKKHTWTEKGIGCIVPSALALSLSGHQIFSPDMIGGGEVKDIIERCRLKEDIFMAHFQIALLMPNIQFSILPKKVLAENYPGFLRLLKLREKYIDYILELYENLKESREPMIRLLEYAFPGEGYGYEKSMFMLGEKYLVIPITNERMIKEGLDFKLPGGIWKFKNKIYRDRESIHITFTLYDLVILEKLDKVNQRGTRC